MSTINKVIIIGNLGRDPEVRYMPSGGAVCNVSLATSRSWKDKTSGEKVEETEWHRVVLFDRLAEVAGEWVGVGDKIYIEGYLKTRKWQDKDGVEKYSTEIVAERMQMLSSRNSGGQDDAGGSRQRQSPQHGRGGRGEGGYGGGRQQQQPHPRGRGGSNDGHGQSIGTQARGNAQRQRTGTGFDNMEDDIPF